MEKVKIVKKTLTGERALFRGENLEIVECTFEDGESPLKESKNVSLYRCTFGWKYPVWYSKNVTISNCRWLESGRAGVWYTKNLVAENSEIDAPKTFRRCENLVIKNCALPKAQETLWHCKRVALSSLSIDGDYFGMNCDDVDADGIVINGNYCFDGAKNITIKNSVLNSKDAFWNSENVRCENCVITGEYLGWNSKNLTFVNCKIESLQGLCYIENLTLENCDLTGTSLALEFCSEINARIKHIESIKNPISGKIEAESIDEIILDEKVIDTAATEIIILSKTEKSA